MDYEQRAEAHQQAMRTRGASVHRTCTRLTLSSAFLAGNVADFQEAIQQAPVISLKSFDRAPAQSTEEANARRQSMTIARRLFNAAASASTLVEHSRRAASLLTEDSARATWATIKQEDAVSAPIVQFVHGLRNYLVHVDTPPVFLRTAFDGNRSCVRIASNELLKWTKWSASARNFLAATQSIDIAQVMSAYLITSDGLCSRLLELLMVDRSKDLADFYTEIDRIDKSAAMEGLQRVHRVTRRFVEISGIDALARARQ
jgi:hypothetical protein